MRDSPSGGNSGTIESATENVLEVARDPSGSYFLVVYPSPNDHSKTLAGRVYKDALENTGWSLQAQAKRETFAAAAGKLGCSMTQSHLRTDHDFCGGNAATTRRATRTAARSYGLAY